jgi:hypothetical protein
MKMMPASNSAHKVIKYWCHKKDLTFESFFDEWIEAVILRKVHLFYDSLEDPRIILKINKLLENVKIQNVYKLNRCT